MASSSASDVYQGDYCARRMAEQLADALPDWSIALMPTLWYGIDGANLIPERYDIRGTISLRPSTLRALAADLGIQLADQGFRWLFLVHIHGAALACCTQRRRGLCSRNPRHGDVQPCSVGGRGVSGDRFQARLSQSVAIKVLPAAFTQDAESLGAIRARSACRARRNECF